MKPRPQDSERFWGHALSRRRVKNNLPNAQNAEDVPHSKSISEGLIVPGKNVAEHSQDCLHDLRGKLLRLLA